MIEMKLKGKYTRRPLIKATRSSVGGNSGGVGRRAKAAKRGHGGGQETAEMKEARLRQSREAQERRSEWFAT